MSGRLRRRVYMDRGGDETKIVVQSHQDCTDILRLNRALYNAEQRTTRLCPGDEWRLVASIPLAIVEKWGRQGAWLWEKNDAKLITRLLNDPEWSSLRTAPGRL